MDRDARIKATQAKLRAAVREAHKDGWRESGSMVIVTPNTFEYIGHKLRFVRGEEVMEKLVLADRPGCATQPAKPSRIPIPTQKKSAGPPEDDLPF